MYASIYIHVCIYIYIERERCMYIYIYMYTCASPARTILNALNQPFSDQLHDYVCEEYTRARKASPACVI